MQPSRKTTTKRCDACGSQLRRLYRVKSAESAPWFFVCDDCWPVFKRDAIAYTYGGTWTDRKRS